MNGAFSEANNPNGEWIRLVSFGQYEHSKGLRVVDPSTALSKFEDRR